MRRVVAGFDKDGNAVFKSDGETTSIVRMDGYSIDFLNDIWAAGGISTIRMVEIDKTVSMASEHSQFQLVL